ncbi:MAG: hypothetical protein AB7G93_08975 [Bdellovibrionales bacterium]
MDVVKPERRKNNTEEKELNTLHLQHPQATDITVQDSARVEHCYHQLPALRHETRDVLKQLQSKISTLEDMSGRLGFVLGELRSLIRR